MKFSDVIPDADGALVVEVSLAHRNGVFHVNPRPCRQGGDDATPISFSGMSAGRIALKFCLAYGAYFAQLLVNID